MTVRSTLLIALTLLTLRNTLLAPLHHKQMHMNILAEHISAITANQRNKLKVQQIRLHINGSIYFQLKDAIDRGLLVCMRNRQKSEELFFASKRKVKGIQANQEDLYKHIWTWINQIINKFVILWVGNLDKERLRVAMH